MPIGRPSIRAHRRAAAIASRSVTVATRSSNPTSRTDGVKPGPIPWIPCGPGSSPFSTALSAGSTPITCSPALRGLSARAIPVAVPPVPTPAITTSTLPSVSVQISSAVVAA